MEIDSKLDKSDRLFQVLFLVLFFIKLLTTNLGSFFHISHSFYTAVPVWATDDIKLTEK